MEINREEAERFSRYVGEQVRGEAATRNLTVSALANEMQIDRATLTRYLTGQRALPIPVLYRAAKVVGLEPGEIIDRAESRMIRDMNGHEQGDS